jgi:hypothetical protein
MYQSLSFNHHGWVVGGGEFKLLHAKIRFHMVSFVGRRVWNEMGQWLKVYARRKRRVLFHEERMVVDWNVPLITFWNRVPRDLKWCWNDSFTRRKKGLRRKR